MYENMDILFLHIICLHNVSGPNQFGTFDIIVNSIIESSSHRGILPDNDVLFLCLHSEFVRLDVK